jgi:5-methyltetrahydrofolate--homocysteine methyltransferase
MRLSGLEAVTLDAATNFVNVGERTNVTGQNARLIKEGKFQEALGCSKSSKFEEQVIDINID